MPNPESPIPNPEVFMAQALELAARGSATTHPNPRVGCVIVRDGKVVGEGWHERAGGPHAEIHALKAAGAKAVGAEVFVSLEPCCHQGRTGPCTEALIQAGVKKVWAAMPDPNPQVSGQGFAALRAAGIECATGLLQREAENLNRGFLSRMRRARPFVTLKLAASLDGRTAMDSGESKWITSEAARADVQRLRAEAGAVLTSSATVIADDPQLNCRDSGFGIRDSESIRPPDRIVLDTHARVAASAKVWNRDGARRYWLTHSLSPMPVGHGGEGWGEGAVVQDAELAADGYLDLAKALQRLATHGINEVLVECGPRLAGALLQARLVDELVLYLAPSLLGHEARPLALLPGLKHLSERIVLKFTDTRQIGPDLRLTAEPLYP